MSELNGSPSIRCRSCRRARTTIPTPPPCEEQPVTTRRPRRSPGRSSRPRYQSGVPPTLDHRPSLGRSQSSRAFQPVDRGPAPGLDKESSSALRSSFQVFHNFRRRLTGWPPPSWDRITHSQGLSRGIHHPVRGNGRVRGLVSVQRLNDCKCDYAVNVKQVKRNCRRPAIVFVQSAVIIKLYSCSSATGWRVGGRILNIMTA